MDNNNFADNFAAFFVGWLTFAPIITIVVAIAIFIAWQIEKSHKRRQQWLDSLPPPPPGAWQDPQGNWHNPIYPPPTARPYPPSAPRPQQPYHRC